MLLKCQLLPPGFILCPWSLQSVRFWMPRGSEHNPKMQGMEEGGLPGVLKAKSWGEQSRTAWQLVAPPPLPVNNLPRWWDSGSHRDLRGHVAAAWILDFTVARGCGSGELCPEGGMGLNYVHPSRGMDRWPCRKSPSASAPCRPPRKSIPMLRKGQGDHEWTVINTLPLRWQGSQPS